VSLGVAFGAVIAGIVVWLALVRKLSARSWEPDGAVIELGSYRQLDIPAAKIGFWTLLAVITSLFGLFISAYYMRMNHSGTMGGHTDWSSIPKPSILWLNTVCLVAASMAMQWARNAARRRQLDMMRSALVTGGMLTLAFLAGQLSAWAQVSDSLCFTLRNPAIAFFYLLTAVHGAHLLGGIFVWGKTLARSGSRHAPLDSAGLTVELCSVYWHYLLLIWLLLFGLLLLT
jgi:cytochrome c oxidase subunit 3